MVVKILIIFFIFFLSPLIIFGVSDLIKRELNKGKKVQKTIKNTSTTPEIPLKQKVKLWKKFAFKESKNKVLCIALYLLIPIVLSILGAVLNKVFLFSVLSAIFSFIYIVIIRLVTRKQYDIRQKTINNLLIFKKSKMGLIEPSATVHSYQTEFTIENWSENDTPTKIIFIVPITFAADSRVTFIGDLAEKFSFNGFWREDEQDGWDDGNNTVTVNWHEFFSQKQTLFITNFLEFKRKSMGLVNNKSTIFTYYNEFDVLEWDEEEKPTKMRIKIPIGYDTLQQNTFLDKMSDGFGRGRPWEIDNDDKEFPGWNTDLQIATLSLQRPLPEKAMWSEKYIKNDIVQWSFFPLGIGSKGGVPFIDPDTGEEVRLVGFDVNGAQGKFLRKKGIFVGGDLLPSPHLLGAGVTGGGKSVCQRNIILGCLMRPENWFLIIIDMKKVEGSLYRKFGVPVATTYEDAACLLSYAQTVMMERFEYMEKMGINNWADVPEEKRGTAIMVNVDEVAELLAPIKGKSDEDKMNADFQAQCLTAMESIARLGRAAQVHLATFGQRPSSDVVSMQIRQNSPTRMACGALPATISQMVFEGNFGATVPANPQGRIGLRIHSVPPFKAQGFFADEDWLEDYLKRYNLPINIQGSHEMAKQYSENKAQAEAENALLGDIMTEEEYDLVMSAIEDY